MLTICSYSPSPNQLAGDPVEDAAVRGGEDFPGDRAEKGRGHERGGDKGANEPTQRQVGARHQPGERQGRRRRPQRNAGGDFERRQIRSREARIGGQAHEIGRSQRAVIVGDAVPDEPSERQQDQAAQKQREQDHDRSRQVDRADCPFTGARQRDGHRDNTIVCAIIEPRPPAGAARGFVPSLPGEGGRTDAAPLTSSIALPGHRYNPKYSAYFFLISAVSFSWAAVSGFIVLISESGFMPGGSVTSGCTERIRAISTSSCCPSFENR